MFYELEYELPEKGVFMKLRLLYVDRIRTSISKILSLYFTEFFYFWPTKHCLSMLTRNEKKTKTKPVQKT